MVNQQVLSGKWNELRGMIQERWGKLTDDDVRTFNGNVDQLIGRIQQKTGESRASIEKFLGEVTEEGSGMLSGVRDRIEETAGQAAEGARQGVEALRQRYADAERAVQERPSQAMAVAFGLGILSGLGVALLLRGRSPEHHMMASGRGTERFARQMADALSSIVPDSLKKS